MALSVHEHSVPLQLATKRLAELHLRAHRIARRARCFCTVLPRSQESAVRSGLNHPAFEPIEGINEGINDAVLRLVSNHPGRGVPFFRATLKASRSGIERAVAALVAAGAIEHRGSRKTGGYWAKGTPEGPPAPARP